jgi:hypothetical protein
MWNYFRTWIGNLIFIIFLPLLLAIGFDSNWILAVYCLVYSLGETIVDLKYYSSIRRLKITDEHIGIAYITTIVFNAFLMIFSSYTVSALITVSAALSQGSVRLYVILAIVTVISIVSVLETMVDNRLYKGSEKYKIQETDKRKVSE